MDHPRPSVRRCLRTAYLSYRLLLPPIQVDRWRGVSLLVTTDDVALDPDREHVIKYLGYTRPPAACMHLRIGGPKAKGKRSRSRRRLAGLGPWRPARLVSASDRRPCPRLPCSGPEKKRWIAILSYPISRFFVRVWTAADSFETPRPCYRAYILLITCSKQNHFCLMMSWFTILDLEE